LQHLEDEHYKGGEGTVSCFQPHDDHKACHEGISDGMASQDKGVEAFRRAYMLMILAWVPSCEGCLFFLSCC
jgi:hypothetical protein